MGVVHRLETVEIEKHHAHHSSSASRPCQGVIEPVHDQCPVGQPGERVVTGFVCESMSNQERPFASSGEGEHTTGETEAQEHSQQADDPRKQSADGG